MRTTKLLTRDELLAQLRSPRASLSAMRDAANRIEDLQGRLDRIGIESAGIATALGKRGLIDFADDVRMLAKM